MAKRSYHRKKKSPARTILILVLLIGAGVVIWQLWGKSEPIIEKDQLDQAMLGHAPGGDRETSSNPPPEPGGTRIQPGDTETTTTPPPDDDTGPGNTGGSGSVANPGGTANPGGVSERTAAQALQAVKLFEQGRSAWQAKKYLAARDALSDAVKLGLMPEQEKQARQMLNEAADQWLFSRDIYEGDEFCRLYKVASGDMLVNLQKQFAVPYKLLMRVNNITNENNVPAGKSIKVVQGPFHVLVDRSRFMMSVYLGDVLVRSYKVGLGKTGRQTPTGLWKVKLKQENPAWYDAEAGKNYLPNDPENPLGERWIAIEGLEGPAEDRTGFGIHGTIKPDEIGKAASRGCIRLYNGDVRELYDLLMEGQSLVRVID
jgi:lipoprotein-anchoring transpeptidase ErfK/SrfK